MALSKIKGTVIADDAINADRIADGTVVASDLLDNTLTGAKLATDIAITTSGNITTTGAFTSTGIDDNATSTAITIDSSENVGIGTASPTSGLHIESNSSAAKRKLRIAYDGSYYYDFSQAGAAGLYFNSVGALNHIWQNNGSEVMRIAGSNVGIGTSSPQAPLHIVGTSSISTEFKIGNSSWNQSNSNSGLLHQYRGSDGYSELQINSVTTSPTSAFIIRNSTGIAVNFTNDGASTFDGKLTVNDTIEANSISNRTSLQGVDATPDDVNRFELGAGYLNLYRDDNSEVNQIQFGKSGTLAAAFSTGADYLAIKTNGDNERMRILNNGNVAIGRTTANFGGLGTDHTVLTIGTTTGMGQLELAGFRSSDADLGRLIFGNKNVRLSEIVAKRTGADNSNALSFSTSSSGSNTERMRIDSSGKVGIGETSMDALLVIKGNSDESTTPSIRLKDGSDSREAWITNNAGDLILTTGGNDNVAHTQLRMLNGNLMTFKTNNSERMRINSDGAVSIASTNVTQNSHFNVRQDNNSHATRTYINANVASGALYSIKYLGTIPVVSSGTQLLIPFISQSNINSKTYVHIRGMSCESNTSDPKAFDVKFSIGHISSLGTLTVLQRLGTCSAVSKSGMNVVLSFAGTNYQHSGDNGMFIEIDYIAHHQDASIDLSGIVMN